MRSHPSWGYDRYLPLDRAAELNRPYIRRLCPSTDKLTFSWAAPNGAQAGTVTVRLLGQARGHWLPDDGALDASIPGAGKVVRVFTAPVGENTVSGLDEGCEYNLTVEADGLCSDTRRFRTGAYPGSVVEYLHPDDPAFSFSGRYLCSPSVCRAPDGSLLASMDVYAGGRPQNLERIFRSEDEGASWTPVCELFPCFWGALFTHRGALYMLGMSNEYGDLLIGRSCDSGRSWSAPSVLFRGSCCSNECGLHHAPMPVVEHGGRLWTEIDYGAWGPGHFSNSLCSCPSDGDLLDPVNWVSTGFLPYNPDWPGASPFPGAIEGNALVLPDGEIGALLRLLPERALLLRGHTNDPEAPLQFEEIVPMPFAHTKFVVRRLSDDRYAALGNPMPDRRTLAVSFSRDLRAWDAPRPLICGDGLEAEYDAHQYPDFFTEGNTLLVLSRTARNGAHSFHDSNCATFHTFEL